MVVISRIIVSLALVEVSYVWVVREILRGWITNISVIVRKQFLLKKGLLSQKGTLKYC